MSIISGAFLDYTTARAFRVLRQPSRPKPARPVANSGRAAGSGVGVRSVVAVRVKVAPGPRVKSNIWVITKGAAKEAINRLAVSLPLNVTFGF